MIKSRTYLIVEFTLLFVLIPLSLVTPIYIWIKVAIVLIGFGYLLKILRKFEGLQVRLQHNIAWASFIKRVVVTFIIIAVITILFVWNTAPNELFYVPYNNPGLFVIIVLLYTLLSVWPQEVIYRTFFFARYTMLFQNKMLLVFVNALVFALAHLFFKNILVLILTFIGGILFGFTYLKLKSTTLVTIEHAIYGNWLFTVGMGNMLAFPGMENESPF